jgi:hypothetical protein
MWHLYMSDTPLLSFYEAISFYVPEERAYSRRLTVRPDVRPDVSFLSGT